MSWRCGGSSRFGALVSVLAARMKVAETEGKCEGKCVWVCVCVRVRVRVRVRVIVNTKQTCNDCK